MPGWAKTYMIFIAALFGAAMLFSCENDLQEVKRLTSGLEIPPTEIYKYQSIRTDSGFVISRIYGGKVVVSSADDKGKNISREISDSLMVIIYKQNTSIAEMIMTSERGADYPLRQKAEASGNVIVVNEKGDSLITERILWDKAKKSIYSDNETRIVMHGDVIIGKKGFWADESMRQTKIFQTEGLISIEDSLKTEDEKNLEGENIQQTQGAQQTQGIQDTTKNNLQNKLKQKLIINDSLRQVKLKPQQVKLDKSLATEKIQSLESITIK